ncbi:mRNA cap methyltransferase-like protein,putative [Trypanosoma brucei gambiense DAL972]|uniref:mRNA (guanine-N(7))-methyltransferase n=1 Tax=Trypanosoma brucei gambiense (strain MHOM/CI/86/DAL972) TaxID=679716 RepID=C9ZSC4_TRYB9|nr:mRNA cap methyltransferase-like protein,putative [Trypanosoma brucei gambiense DAL972]CBH12262.1 mRNA cap methyltransferase-like protein,putative [Trypanosoma brucei gambiense DAL972]|eukprot:XP_011774543.1 mRNA cap methyltransferase-like protein,putative [Trypanosoma brucei gambiense DAL972]
MESTSSLSDLHKYAERRFGRSLLIPVDEEFVKAVHSPVPSEASEVAPAVDFVEAYRNLVSRNLQRKRTANNAPTSPASSGVPKFIYAHAAEAVVGTRVGEFMGPLCSPLRKSHASMLRSAPYFVTEKSDGTRVVLVSLIAPLGPSWSIEDKNGGDVLLKHVGRLDDVVALEEARQQLCQENTAQVGDLHQKIHLSFGHFAVERWHEKSSYGTVELFALRCCENGSSSSQGGGDVIRAERLIGKRHMAYCFDRSMDYAYLLLEEHAVPSLHSFVVDAELMVPIQKGSARLLLGCFDVFRYVIVGESAPRDVVLTRAHTSARHAALRKDIIEPMEEFQRGTVGVPLLRIFAKEMFPLNKFGDCVLRLRCGESANHIGGVVYLYDGPYGWTKSDGFIFTPEKFDILQGASKTQLKWKWPSMLSVDWSLTAFEGQNNFFVVDSFFRKKRFGHQPDSCGHVRLSSKMSLLNPFSLPIPTRGSVVAECVFDRVQKCWSIERLRNDKAEANSIVTIISVMESLVEDITLSTLFDLIGLNDTSLPSEKVHELESAADMVNRGGERGSTAAIQDVEEKHEKKRCQFTLRATQLQAQGEHEIHLYWGVRLPSEKAHVPCIHCKVSECTGFGFACPAEDPTSRLREYLYIALANAGGSCAWSDFTVEAVFNGGTGRWNIASMQPNGDNKRSTCVGVIHHLQWLLQRGVDSASPESAETPERVIPLHLQGVERPAALQVEQVNAHYACKTKELSTGKNRSILRHYNNWIKGVLISTSVSYLRSNNKGGEFDNDGMVVADLCSGRGGDLHKWRAHQPKLLFMTDCCLEAVAEAAARYSITKGLSIKVVPHDKNPPGIRAQFCVLDVFDEKGSLVTKLEEFLKQCHDGGKLDVVSCQFSIHYGCSNEERVRVFLSAVSSTLKSGGIFIGTTVSDTELLRRLRQYGTTFGNGIYTVRFPTDAVPNDSFGVEYSVSFESSVSEMPEYVVPWNRFVNLCGAYNLQLVESFGFVEYGDMHYNSALGQELRDASMNGGRRDSDGHLRLRLSPDEAEAAGLFRTFLFVKI